MIARIHRFHGHNSLTTVYRRSQTVRSAQLSLKYAAREPRRPYRIAVVVSKKVNKRAVVRNRLRRRIYEAARLQASDFGQPCDLIFTVFSDQLLELSGAELAATVASLFTKAAVTRPANSSS